jgi:hypothetical protein
MAIISSLQAIKSQIMHEEQTLAVVIIMFDSVLCLFSFELQCTQRMSSMFKSISASIAHNILAP